jgi:hypothetical protein
MPKIFEETISNSYAWKTKKQAKKQTRQMLPFVISIFTPKKNHRCSRVGPTESVDLAPVLHKARYFLLMKSLN